ncbi:MAG: hypothetical protein CW691_09540 [Candidatus Bathyarchaeum sp.]|nr:MAG: hypothetical protein CW691_09540 [Candidatus Bathyarchaeum sp.]
MFKSAKTCQRSKLLFFIFFVATLFLSVPSTVLSSSSGAGFELYGGDLDDEAAAIVQSSDKGYVIAATTGSFGAGDADFWLIKLDSNGNMQWNHTYGGVDSDVASAMIQTSDGGYAIAGNTWSFGAGESDFWLIKVDSSGVMQWNKTYGQSASDGAYSLIQVDDGGYALAGYSTANNQSKDVCFVKADSAGNVQWTQTYGGSRSDYANSVVQTSDGGYALAATTRSFSDDSSSDGWLIKTDSDGNMDWNKTYDGYGGFDGANALLQTSEQGYVFAGHTGGFMLQDVWVVKTDYSNGSDVWSVTLDTHEPLEASCLIQTSDGGYAVAGWMSAFEEIFDSYSVLLKLDLNGNIQWNSSYTGLGYNGELFVVQSDDGGYALAGTTKSTDEGAHYDVWFARVDPSGETIPEFSAWLILPLTMAVTLIVAAMKGKKLCINKL